MNTGKPILEEHIFQDILLHWQESPGNQRFWPELAEKYRFKSGEILRSIFKRERAKRGISKVAGHVTQDFSSFPKVGVMDVETLPAKGYFWSLWDQTISLSQLIDDGCLLSWAGKYLNDDKVIGEILTPKEAVGRDPRRITESAWEFLNSCDIVIGHNFKNFDGKVLNTHFLLYAKPVKVTTIDTLEIAKKNMQFLSNKMAFINAKLGIRQKIDNDGFSLWARCAEGDPEALATMMAYNKGDILSTEDLYFKLRPFAPNHPNLALYNEIETEQCPVCLGTDLKVEGEYATPAALYEKVRCQSCGSINRRKENLLSKTKRKKLLASAA